MGNGYEEKSMRRDIGVVGKNETKNNDVNNTNANNRSCVNNTCTDSNIKKDHENQYYDTKHKVEYKRSDVNPKKNNEENREFLSNNSFCVNKTHERENNKNILNVSLELFREDSFNTTDAGNKYRKSSSTDSFHTFCNNKLIINKPLMRKTQNMTVIKKFIEICNKGKRDLSRGKVELKLHSTKTKLKLALNGDLNNGVKKEEIRGSNKEKDNSVKSKKGNCLLNNYSLIKSLENTRNSLNSTSKNIKNSVSNGKKLKILAEKTKDKDYLSSKIISESDFSTNFKPTESVGKRNLLLLFNQNNINFC